MAGKKLTALEMPEEDADGESVTAAQGPESSSQTWRAPQTIPLPPIPPAPRREIMVQLSVKAPLHLVERLEHMNATTGAQKQQIIAAALDAYLHGHGY